MDECNLEIYEDFIDVRDFDKDNEWVVEFKTEERNDLVIEIIEGDGYSNLDDVEFLELRCGEDKIIPNILTNRIVYEGYGCGGISYARFMVNSEGVFKQRVIYGERSRTVSFKK